MRKIKYAKLRKCEIIISIFVVSHIIFVLIKKERRLEAGAWFIKNGVAEVATCWGISPGRLGC